VTSFRLMQCGSASGPTGLSIGRNQAWPIRRHIAGLSRLAQSFAKQIYFFYL
jgi:hypothetical protein